MQFRQLAALVTVLLKTFGEVPDEQATAFQEDCAGSGNLCAGVRLFHLPSCRRDVTW